MSASVGESDARATREAGLCEPEEGLPAPSCEAETAVHGGEVALVNAGALAHGGGVRADLMYVYIAMAGCKQQGGPGCTVVDHSTGHATYRLCRDLVPIALRDGVQATVEQDDEEHYFILHVQERNVHVTSYPRAKTRQMDWSAYEAYAFQLGSGRPP